jgi:ABC-type uncharacterized transport system permease subunit
MIRDEYKKSQEKRKQSVKEIEGVKKFGARAYYTNSIKKLTANLKTLNFNTWFTFIFSIGLVVFITILLILDFSKIKENYMIIGIILTVILDGWAIAWFLFVKKAYIKKIELYKSLVEEMKVKEMNKQKSIYEMYNKGEK